MNLGVKSRGGPLEKLLEANRPATSVSLTSLRLARLFIEGAVGGFLVRVGGGSHSHILTILLTEGKNIRKL